MMIAMPKFYVFNPDMCDPSEWEHEKQEHEASSAKQAASDMASVWDEDGDDGRMGNVVVAEEADGSDAVLYSVRCCITVEYKVQTRTPFKVEPPAEVEE